MTQDDISVEIAESFRIRLAPCDGCRKWKLIGNWIRIVCRKAGQVQVFYACSEQCQLKVLQEKC